MEDQRRSERIPLDTEVEFESAGARVRAKITNIGLLGVFIETNSPLPVGSRLRLKFSLMGGQEFEAEGLVAHRQTGLGMGVAFISLGSGQAKRVKKFLEGDRLTVDEGGPGRAS